MLISIDRSSDAPIYRQIIERFQEAIAGGRLPPGAQLPTVRQLADGLGVTRLTVQSAYAELQSGGWVEATVGRGTFVSEQVQVRPHWSSAEQDVTPAVVIGDILQMGQAQSMRSMASASPDAALFPAGEFWSCLNEQQQHTMVLTGYAPAQGDAGLRIELAAFLAERGIAASAEQIIVTSGVTQGLTLAAQALAQPGDAVLVEQPTYVGFLHVLRAQGLKPIPVPIDRDGPLPDAIERLATLHRARFLYTIPSFQNPTGYVIAPERRTRLLELASTLGFYVIEDDIYSLMAFDGAPPLPLKAGDDSDRVIYLNSFSKSLMPGLRLGMMVAPPALHERLISLRIAADLGSPLLLQRTLAAFLRRGEHRRHVRKVVPIYRERRNAAMHALDAHMPPDVTWTRPAGGFCCWLTLPRRSGIGEIHRLALAQGWAFAPGSVFLAENDGEHHLRICFGNLPVDGIRRGLEILGQVVRDYLAMRPPLHEPVANWTPLV
ncbi:MAG: PLP-dependent aminotransferase family protein [Caldilinea sp.]|nr:PLP-dependent aminotransferase family protein [Caldilinea sp.]